MSDNTHSVIAKTQLVIHISRTRLGNTLSFCGIFLNTRPAQSKSTVEITMKSKLIITCLCLGLLGGASACTGDEKATTASDESAGSLSGTGEAKVAEKQAAKADDSPSGEGEQLTNADCFTTSAPDSASQWAKACIDMAKAHPDMPFTPNDYRGMPEDCKPFVNPKCR
jgi:hypothetical protein